MNTKNLKHIWTCVVIAVLLLPLVGFAQGQLGNLDFEAATVSPSQAGGSVPVAEGLPDWTVYLGTQQQGTVLFNATDNTDATVDLLGPGWQRTPGEEPGVLGGLYSVYLQSGFAGTFVPASIAQDGTVPGNAESVQFKAWEMFGGTFSVSFNGNDLPLNLLSTGVSPSGQQFNLYGVNIAPYAGQSGLLEFTENTLPSSGESLILDDINFSTSSVPEPSSIVLTGVAAAAFAIRRRWALRQ